MRPGALAAIACCALSFGCGGRTVKPVVVPVKPAGDALLVLPGFGYSRAGEQAFRSLAEPMAADGVDLYLPTFVARAGLEQSRARLRRFIRDSRLDRYAHVHVFAFIAGGWAFNPMIGTGALPNLSTVVYDRSPYQERAPRVARDTLPLLAWAKFGPVIFDVARTPYPPAAVPGVHVGLMVETVPTGFIKRFARTAEREGPYHFECDGFGQRNDDCLYVALDHRELYVRFAEVWPEVLSFIRTGSFTTTANRTRPASVASRRGGQ